MVIGCANTSTDLCIYNIVLSVIHPFNKNHLGCISILYCGNFCLRFPRSLQICLLWDCLIILLNYFSWLCLIKNTQSLSWLLLSTIDPYVLTNVHSTMFDMFWEGYILGYYIIEYWQIIAKCIQVLPYEVIFLLSSQYKYKNVNLHSALFIFIRSYYAIRLILLCLQNKR